MADHSLIEWTDATWQPITGCSIVSPGCTNCYAMKLAGTRLKNVPSRVGLTFDSKAGPIWNGKVRFNEQWLDQPLRWREPRKIFVCAHGDLFAENVPDEWIDMVFASMALAPQHTFQVLTKRAGRMREYLSGLTCDGARRFNIVAAAGRFMDDGDNAHDFVANAPWPLPNVWLGVSAEDQVRADERIPELLATPAAVRFVSAEPLLGPMDLGKFMWPVHPRWPAQYRSAAEALAAGASVTYHRQALVWAGRSFIDWVIVGGESGQGARPMHPQWVRSLRDQCAAAGTAFFFKQWGEWAPICFMSEEQTDACYVPAPARNPEAVRRCKVDQCVLHANGERFDLDAYSREVRRSRRRMFEADFNAMTMFSIGKKRAGRRLDGIEHNAMPEVR